MIRRGTCGWEGAEEGAGAVRTDCREKYPARNPFNQSLCSRAKGALSGMTGTSSMVSD
jgi:hypothetical protein